MSKATKIEALIRANAEILVKNPVKFHMETFQQMHKVFIHVEKPRPQNSCIRHAGAYWVSIYNTRKGEITNPLSFFPLY